ncbi:MAG: fructose bisphosphate aldolase [Sphingopyxis sp.]|nr:fructose bisphosphate aldolase [Sphingopyxis sp.]
MSNQQMLSRIESGRGFIAALDQSGGSAPGALRHYGITEDAYSDDSEMLRLMHQFRARIVTAPSFTSAKILGAILFEGTMDGQVQGRSVPEFLWRERAIVPLLKIDKGLEPLRNGVRLMKPIPELAPLLERAKAMGIFGTKMRSVIAADERAGIFEVVRQQFEVGAQIAEAGLMPILEPEVSIDINDKVGAEVTLLKELVSRLDALPTGVRVMLKLTIPSVPGFYLSLTEHPSVIRVLALSGGYSRAAACAKLASNPGLIASFSRALLEDLMHQTGDEQFNRDLERAIDEIYAASDQL